MGKKTKVGKQRKDKYYHLAKEAGYRSRAAFKLIQLNKRFEFLQNSRALVDLCAAPGGWLQVATQNMPVSSIRIGVDLVSIKPIPNCITLQGDIREEKTRSAVRKELQKWEADCVLHDGAPNVGLNWSYDAFQQNCLTLHALRLATQILCRNGYFVTKIFRSSDYLSLIGVFEKLFKKIHVWKPAASRLESAEIFVVCEKYVKPSHVNSELLDIKKVFKQQAEAPTVNPISIITSKKKEKKKKAIGYEEDDITQFHELKASDFILSNDPLLMLSQASCITLDEERYKISNYTTNEIIECIRDIKVCGPAELRNILQWRKKILADIKKENQEKEKNDKPEETEESKELQELQEIDELIQSAQADEKAKIKKKKRQTNKEKKKLEQQKEYDMVPENDAPVISEDIELFSLTSIQKLLNRRKQIEENLERYKKKKNNEEEAKQYDSDLENENYEWEERDGVNEGTKLNNDNDAKNDIEMNEEGNLEQEEEFFKQNILQNDESLMTKTAQNNFRSEQWMSKINDLLSDDDDDEDDETFNVIAKHMQRRVSKSELLKNSVTFDDEKKTKKRKNDDFEKPEDLNNLEDNESTFENNTKLFDDNEENVTKKKPKILTPMQLALGEQMIYSAKKAKNLEEWGWNKYANNDTNLPDWFTEDEKKHFKKDPPVAKKRIEYYEKQNRELNVRPIKKVLEAKARKQKHKLRRMEKAKKRAENILQNENMEHSEKVREMKKVYKQAKIEKKKDVKYQVITKGKRGRMARPNGPYRVVDKRLKKDKRGMERARQRKGKNGRFAGKKPRSKKH